MGSTDEVRVGIIGSGQIAGAHSAAYRTVAGTYPEARARGADSAVADVDRERAGALAQAWGWSRAEVDWRAVTQADDVDLVDICVPNALHAGDRHRRARPRQARGVREAVGQRLVVGPSDGAGR